MKHKSLLNLSLAATASLAATMSFIVIANNHTNVNLVRSDDQETLKVILNKDTIFSNLAYQENGNPTTEYAFFKMKYEGNYVALDNYSYRGGVFGGNHLYENICDEVGGGYRLKLHLENSQTNVLYFDQEKTQKVNCPTFQNILKVEMWLGAENEMPLIPSELPGYTVTQDPGDANHYTITKSTWGESITLLGTTIDSTYVGKKMVMDQVVITYSCHNA